MKIDAESREIQKIFRFNDGDLPSELKINGTGDTLYFLGSHGQITHTAIYLGKDQYLESAGPGVRISSLNPNDPNFDIRRSKQLAFAKRLLE